MHILGPIVTRVPDGTRLFPNLSPAGALAALRTILVGLEVEKAECYRTHDLRRGHALDLQLSGLLPFWHDLNCRINSFARSTAL